MQAMKRFRGVMAKVAIGLVMAFGVAGCGNDGPPQTGSVSGKIVDAISQAPVSGVTVQLLNSAFKPYTSAAALARFGSYSAMDAANRAGIAGTATTGSDGAYRLTAIPNGTYQVIARTNDNLQSFSPKNDAGSDTVVVNGNAATLDFDSAILATADIQPSFFTVNVTFRNIPGAASSATSVTSIVILRRSWALFVPQYNAFLSSISPNAIVTSPNAASVSLSANSFYSQAEPVLSISAPYGYTSLFYTVDNYYYFSVLGDAAPRRETPPIYFPLGSTPATSSFVYDYATNTMTRTQ